MNRIFTYLGTRTRTAVMVLAIVTALLAIPFLAMSPDESASTEPAGAVFDARDLVDDRFVSSVHPVGVIAEHASGDLLRAEPLRELLDAQQRLQDHPEIGPTLFSYYNADAGIEVTGPFSIVDIVDAQLRSDGVDGVRAATDAQVAAAATAVIDRFGGSSELLGLSQLAEQRDGRWIVPAAVIQVVSDDTILGFGNTSVNLGGDTDVEEYDRDIQEVLRTAPGWQMNGIAIDVNLTSQEQGAIAGPFIGFTVLAALLLVGLTFRSYWVMATVSVMFLALIVWLKGVTNLIGFKDDLVLSLIVPIAMVSFGVDYAFHSIGRYREERNDGKRARVAAHAGAVAVSGALVLATMSDSVAFLANSTAGIESIVQFGIGAAIALAGAYLLLGVLAPFVVAWIESAVPPPTPGRRSSITRIAGAVGAAMMTMASVLLLVFVLPWLGLAMAVATVFAILVVPAMIRSRRRSPNETAVGNLDLDSRRSPVADMIGRVVGRVARYPKSVVLIAVAVTAVAASFAVQVPARFDVEDFFSADTDFVVGLNQLDKHVGSRDGEPATIYIEGDLTDPVQLSALQDRLAQVEALDSPALARDGDRVAVHPGIFEVFAETWKSPEMPALVLAETGVELTDRDGDQIPDTREQVRALLTVASQAGVPLDQSRLALTPDDVSTAVDLGEGRADATVLSLAIVNSRNQESVTAARAALEPLAQAISEDLGGSFVQTTGSAFVREASLEGTNRALTVSLPIALLACLAVATVFLRSIRYGLASVIPILMVVAWLYAFMELAGFAINLVTATIAAVSIGIGIDFALHYISRYREELDRWGVRSVAVRVAGEGTGSALVASAVSSAVGFGILAFAPMPLFAAYGLLTAIMILMALVATLVVLPSVLVLVTHDAPAEIEPTSAEQPALGSELLELFA